MRYAVLALTGVAFMMMAVHPAEAGVPSFENHPVTVTYTQPGVSPQLVRGEFSWKYRTRVRRAAAEVAPNFAGKYIVEQWGCGTSCQTGAIINAETGEVHQLPTTSQGADFRLDSTLFIADPLFEDQEFIPSYLTTRYYVWDGQTFHLVHEEVPQ